MDQRTSRTALLLVAVVALLAGVVGASIGTLGPAVGAQVGAEVGGHHGRATKAMTKHKVVELAAKQVRTWVPQLAPQLTVGNASALGGQAPDAYRTSAFTVRIKDFAGSAATVDRTLPAVPAGTYQVSMALSATMASSAAALVCSLYQDGVATDLLTAYGNALSSWRTVAATRTVTVTGPLKLQCQGRLATTGLPLSPIIAIPANPAYAPAQVSFVRVDTATALPDAG